jgi:hypothetical protein
MVIAVALPGTGPGASTSSEINRRAGPSTEHTEERERTTMKRLTLLGIALLTFLGPMTGWSQTNEFSREGKWDAYVFGLYGKIALVDVSAYEAGLGVGYNIYDQLNVSGEFGAGALGAEFEGVGGSTALLSGHLALDYNILKKPVTPFIGIGAGLYYAPDASDCLYSGNLDLGLRWDINDRWFAKASYQPTLLMHQGLSGGILANLFTVGVGIKF